jgi:hypothetical protein
MYRTNSEHIHYSAVFAHSFILEDAMKQIALDVTTGVVMTGFVGVATMWMMVLGG